MSLSEIKKRLGTDSDDLYEIRKIIKKEISKVHPDKYNSDGDFPNGDVEKQYNELMDMLNFIEKIKNQGNDLYVSQYSKLIEQQNEIIEQQDLVIKLNKKEAVNSERNKVNDNINDRIIEIKSRSKVPEFSLAAFYSVIGFILLFPEKFKNHPIIGPYLKNNLKEFTYVWIMFILLTICAFALLFRRQNKSIKIMNMIKSEQYQDGIFDKFMYEFVYRYEGFDKEMLVEYMYKNINYHRTSIIDKNLVIDSEILYEVSDIIIKKALNKNIIEVVKTNTLRDKYNFKY